MNKALKTWAFILSALELGQRIMLLYVLESIGSSPGRQGFFMAITEDGKMEGSIGGGIMEHKMVELSRNQLQSDEGFCLVKKQVHNKSSKKDQSGMICSGEQTLLLYRIRNQELPNIREIVKQVRVKNYHSLKLSPAGIEIINQKSGLTSYEVRSEGDWEYLQPLGPQNTLHIIGGGHCSLALSRYMSMAGFSVIVYDDRKNLHTLSLNNYAYQIRELDDYTELSAIIPDDEENRFIVVMTFGYRTDAIAIRQLISKKCRYLGLLGSQHKIKEMLNDFRAEGIEEKILDRIHAPAGIPINSREPEEIAISIAAEIIKVKNSHYKTIDP